MTPRVHYIKLGRGGCWEVDAIASQKLRIGWHGQSIADIHAERWDLIAQQLRAEQPGKPGVVTTDLNRLRDIARSTPPSWPRWPSRSRPTTSNASTSWFTARTPR